ncbi:hypothetical protein VAWG006_27510 [Aeromonas enteropelogenes]|uniref:Uncharacterized protein n=1 Tax=Aeromonas sp. 19NY04SH05-1 TaxID=2920537 RepID=A0AAU6T585_9GAMM|nr:hypothetical protein [Aeromonas enteropelogenes]UBH56186.1 hypothetical protein LA341_20310 [Aeromonas enteropelogenes]BEE18498.1 hypothetical protein VAWG006_27510 [Aeromonas enteropelogenes]BEE22660.1 hypothetical protein VAWG007_27550 [Aeromonas enteropelogenes]
MKIKKSETEVAVFAIYWLHGKTYFYGLSKGYDGLLAYDASEVEVLDPELGNDYIYMDDGVFYKPLIEEDILDGLVEADPTAYQRFLEILRSVDYKI